VTDVVEASISGVEGFKVAGVSAGLKKDGRLDFALITSERPCVAAGVFTTNVVKAAPVIVDMQVLEHNAEAIHVIAVNTACANACTGRKGIQDAHVTQSWVGEALGVRQESVLVMSTGVIGTHLPMDKMREGVTIASKALGNDWQATASAIMTTDTRPKSAYVEVALSDGRCYHIAGICKGSGMIAPNMATMLGVIVSDVTLPQAQAQTALRSAINGSFNCIVVDGDMSTNDTVLMLANGASGVELQSADDVAQFDAALKALCVKLAQDIVRDGEGATKFLTINVKGAADDTAAKQVANAIATSALVKTAFYGGDANWGRIIAAAGRSGIQLDPEQLELWLAAGEVYAQNEFKLQLFDKGIAATYSEEEATAIVHQPAASILLNCGAGDGAAVIWTCDLSHDYVSINGSYRS
jgi:glutamate N-acetyltransferase / amino-acid N-acetyltransferase